MTQRINQQQSREQQIMGKQNKKLLKNIKEYEKEKAKQQESKILGQKPGKGEKNKEKSTIL